MAAYAVSRQVLGVYFSHSWYTMLSLPLRALSSFPPYAKSCLPINHARFVCSPSDSLGLPRWQWRWQLLECMDGSPSKALHTLVSFLSSSSQSCDNINRLKQGTVDTGMGAASSCVFKYSGGAYVCIHLRQSATHAYLQSIQLLDWNG